MKTSILKKTEVYKDTPDLIAKEYEEFAYIVSHDLNAPLRHVKEFTRLLIGSRGNDLNEEEKEYVRFLERSLDKLDTMQEALLAFSRLNTRKGEISEVDCNAIVNVVLEDLKEDSTKNIADIKLSNLPVIQANPKHAQTIFHHLIDNALKFHKPNTDNIEVEISAEEKNGRFIFKICDNGIGIDPDLQEDVFRLFRRLKPDEYEGAGTGLTFAKKITQFYGGHIWIESSNNVGTNVFFTLS